MKCKRTISKEEYQKKKYMKKRMYDPCEWNQIIVNQTYNIAIYNFTLLTKVLFSTHNALRCENRMANNFYEYRRKRKQSALVPKLSVASE